jgi:1,2-diacylglycerol 3-beta-galactosyltransferase
MKSHRNERPKILFLFSDTGGGHRSASEALIEALELEFPGQFDTEMVDIFRNAPSPMHLAIPTYPMFAQVPSIWEISYSIFDGRRRVLIANSMLSPYMRQYYEKLIEAHPSDVIVSCHPVPISSFIDILEEKERSKRPPFITVVTDLVTTPAFWYDRRADKIVVPTELARVRGVKLGVPDELFEVIGLPVADRFCHPTADRRAIRERLGWPLDLPMILIVGGAEGMGPIGKNALAIDKARLPAGVAVICGRNKRLKERLEKHSWSIPAYMYGFVREMPEFMAAADVLVTKAGPGTISEAFISGIPLILYSRMPGQEDGNVAYVMEEGAGIWAPQPRLVVKALREWLYNPDKRAAAGKASLRLAKPNAARRIVHLIAASIGLDHPEGEKE